MRSGRFIARCLRIFGIHAKLFDSCYMQHVLVNA